MKKAHKFLLSVFVAVFLLVGSATVNYFSESALNLLGGTMASAVTHSGTCGDNLTWTLDESTGELVISGTGEMTDYSSLMSVPWYNYRKSIKFVTIGDGVRRIGSLTFYYCSKLTNVTIPDSVTSIGENAFGNCTGITGVTIGSGLTSFDPSIFENCTSLSSIIVSDDNAHFSNDEYGVLFNKDKTQLLQYPAGNKRTKYALSDSVTSIGNYAFYDCSRITELTMPISAKIYNSAYTFGGCTNVEKIILTKGSGTVQSYSSSTDSSATYYQYTPWYKSINNLKEIIIEDGVTNIGDYTFYNCIGLLSITIPDSVTSIGEAAFRGCEGLTSITIPDNVTSIGEAAFYLCKKLTSIEMPNSIISIGSHAFFYCTELTSVMIGNEVINIGSYAFYNCTGLASVTIPDSVTSIDSFAFSNCTRLEATYYPGTKEQWDTITIGSNNENLTQNVIYSCYSERPYYDSGTCGENATWILDTDGEFVISGTGETYGYESPKDIPWYDIKTKIKTVTVCDGITGIGDGAFYECANITSVRFSNSVTIIGNYAFCKCTNLAFVKLSANIISIGNAAFATNPNITEIIIPYGVTTIEQEAFLNCTGLTSITIPGSITSIGSSAFSGCTGLTEIYYTGDITDWCAISFGNSAANPNQDADSRFYINGNIVSGEILLPYSVTEICFAAFCGCEDITSVVIPGSVKKIGKSAFAFCTGLTDVTITTNIANIETIVFYKCANIENVRVIGTEEEWRAIGYNDWGESSPEIVFTGNHEEDDHIIYEETVITHPTCTTSGEILYSCICGYSYTEKVYATGHSPELVIVEPTCTQEGYEKFICSVCFIEMQKNVLPATGHSYVMEILIQPTCVAEGLAKHTCLSCGDSYEEVIPETGEHTLQTIRKEPTCKAYGTEYCVCMVCGNMIGDTVILPKSDHTYGEWIVEKIPTATETGSKTHTCTVCDKAENATLPAMEFEMAEGVVIENDTNIISGFNSGLSSLDEYITIGADIYEWSYVTITDKLGTGSKAILKDEDLVIGEYAILVYGDVNGDSWYDGQDAIIVDCLANGMLTQDDVSEAVYIAADCNHDGVIDQFDVDLLNEAGTLLANVDQSKPAEILLETSSEYVEYISLIDQSPEIEDEKTEGVPEVDVESEDTTPEQGYAEVNIFEIIINFIKSIFELLFTYIPVPIN